MTNKTINQINSNVDFMNFIHSNFMNEVDERKFPKKYKMREMPKEQLEHLVLSNPFIAKNIADRQLIRDNIYLKYNFDIFENPIVVFYEYKKNKKLKPFMTHDEAHKFSESLLNNGIYSILILIMNIELECKIYRD